MTYPTMVAGDYHGLDFPTTIEPLLAGGTHFMTAALHRSGIMHADNRVVAVAGFSEFFGGGMGRKVCLTVDYERPEPQLTRELFVKFPRPFGDPLRDLFAPLMESEVRFALLSRRNGFPIAVPTCYYADYHRETLTGILITERIAYGERGIEPCHVMPSASITSCRNLLSTIARSLMLWPDWRHTIKRDNLEFISISSFRLTAITLIAAAVFPIREQCSAKS